MLNPPVFVWFSLSHYTHMHTHTHAHTHAHTHIGTHAYRHARTRTHVLKVAFVLNNRCLGIRSALSKFFVDAVDAGASVAAAIGAATGVVVVSIALVSAEGSGGGITTT